MADSATDRAVPFVLNDRVRLSLALALACAEPDPTRQRSQEAEAAKLGLTGAEVDAARQGRSFDAQISVAIAFALAVRSGELGRIETERCRALRFGIAEAACAEIEALALRDWPRAEP